MSNSFLFKAGKSYFTGTRITDADGNELIQAHPEGGGFQSNIPAHVFDNDENVKLVDSIPEQFVKTYVACDLMPPVLAYMNPNRFWNGWVIPVFDAESEKAFIAAYFYDDAYKYSRKDNVITIEDSYAEDSYEYEDFNVVFNGNEITVNNVIDGWIFSTIDDDILLPLATYHHLRETMPSAQFEALEKSFDDNIPVDMTDFLTKVADIIYVDGLTVDGFVSKEDSIKKAISFFEENSLCYFEQ